MSPVKSPEKLTPPDVGKTDKIVVDKEELPSGWTKEVKIRKTGGSGSARKVDRLYTDPVTGYRFRSLKDVHRYLETGDLGRLAIKPKIDGTEEPRECTESLRQKRASELPERAASKRLAVDVPTPSLLRPKTRQATRLAAEVPSLSPATPKTRQATRLAEGVPSLSPATPKTRQAGIKTVSPPPSDPKTRQAKRVSGIRDNNTSTTSPPQPKTRRATQQAGIKIKSPPDTTTSRRQATRTRLVNSVTPKENGNKSEAEKVTDQKDSITLAQESNEKLKDQSISPPVTPKEQHNKQQIESGPREDEDQAPPTIVPPEKQESSNPVPVPGYGSEKKPDSSSFNFSMNDLWTDPCIEFAVKTLTGAIPIPVRDLNKVENFTAPLEVKVPLQELWTDPCIEFAIKTLTGAIPVGEDDHLPHRPASNTNPHLFSPSDVLSKHYEIGHKNKQQDSVLFPTLGNNNGGLQKSGNFVNGSNGQSSRSRFFQ